MQPPLPAPGRRNEPFARPRPAIGPRMEYGPGLWERDTLDMLQRFMETPQGLMEPASLPMPDSALARCLAHVQDHYLTARGLSGRFSVDPEVPLVEAAEGPLRSLVEHLVEGSLRGNPAPSPYCHVGVSAQDEATVTLYFRDNGVAIPECTFEDVREFIRANKVENVPDRIYRLFLADNLVQWLGGRMWVGPTANGAGTTIFLQLPKKAPKSASNKRLVARHVF